MDQAFQCPLPKGIIEQIVTYAHKTPDQECCGIVTKKGKFLRSKNLSDNPENAFEIDPEIYIKATEQGGIRAIVHSHVNNPDFSAMDIAQIREHGVPWFLFDLHSGKRTWIDPDVRQPYLGRPFIYGFYDCWNLVRDWYEFEQGIVLDNFDYGNPGDWSEAGWNRIMENYESRGFYEVTDKNINPGDVLVMTIKHDYPNHLGLFVDPASNLFLHHLYGKLSGESIYGGWYRDVTTKIMRYWGN